jgi:HAD domain in Swiss Army Knife RNA repair proteins
VKPKDSQRSASGEPKPLLMVDIDGVVSLFGSAGHARPQPGGPARPPGSASSEPRSVDGSFHSIEGIPHFLSSTAAAHLLALSPIFELVWASGWEEKANEHLPRLLGLPTPLPFLRFSAGVGATRSTHAHWKLESIDAYADRRPLAWIDDAFNAACHAWAKARPAPTLLVPTAPEDGLTSREAELLVAWAGELQAG